MRDIKKINWVDYSLIVYRLALDIQSSDEKFDYIVGIPRGGLIPAVSLSHLLKIPVNTSIGNDKILVVDDIVDSSDTMVEWCKPRPNMSPIKMASLYINVDRCENKPDFYGEETKVWIVFPWEIGVTDVVSEVNYTP